MSGLKNKISNFKRKLNNCRRMPLINKNFYNNIKNLEAKVINHLKLNNTALSLEEFVHF